MHFIFKLLHVFEILVQNNKLTLPPVKNSIPCCRIEIHKHICLERF